MVAKSTCGESSERSRERCNVDLERTATDVPRAVRSYSGPGGAGTRGAEARTVNDVYETTTEGRVTLEQALLDGERLLRRVRQKLVAARVEKRDLVAEIGVALAERGPLTVPELGEAIHARHSDIRNTLRKHPQRFACSQGVPGRSPRTKCWINARVAFPTRPDARAESLGSKPACGSDDERRQVAPQGGIAPTQRRTGNN